MKSITDAELIEHWEKSLRLIEVQKRGARTAGVKLPPYVVEEEQMILRTLEVIRESGRNS